MISPFEVMYLFVYACIFILIASYPSEKISKIPIQLTLLLCAASLVIILALSSGQMFYSNDVEIFNRYITNIALYFSISDYSSVINSRYIIAMIIPSIIVYLIGVSPLVANATFGGLLFVSVIRLSCNLIQNKFITDDFKRPKEIFLILSFLGPAALFYSVNGNREAVILFCLIFAIKYLLAHKFFLALLFIIAGSTIKPQLFVSFGIGVWVFQTLPRFKFPFLFFSAVFFSLFFFEDLLFLARDLFFPSFNIPEFQYDVKFFGLFLLALANLTILLTDEIKQNFGLVDLVFLRLVFFDLILLPILVSSVVLRSAFFYWRKKIDYAIACALVVSLWGLTASGAVFGFLSSRQLFPVLYAIGFVYLSQVDASKSNAGNA